MRTVVFQTTFVLFIIVVFASTTSAQDDDSVKINSLVEGSWSLQFQIGENFSFRGFDGLFLAKYHPSQDYAFRGGFSLSAERNEISITEQVDKNWNFTIVFQYIRYLSPGSDLSLYGGIGPSFSLGYFSASSFSTTSKSSSWKAGVRGNIGVEWFVKHNIGLLAEHIGLLEYQRSVFESSTTRREQKRVAVVYSSARLGVSLYF